MVNCDERRTVAVIPARGKTGTDGKNCNSSSPDEKHSDYILPVGEVEPLFRRSIADFGWMTTWDRATISAGPSNKNFSYLICTELGDFPVTQCVAVTTHWGATKVPPQYGKPDDVLIIACHGQSPCLAAVPPTILVFGLTPHEPGKFNSKIQ